MSIKKIGFFLTWLIVVFFVAGGIGFAGEPDIRVTIKGMISNVADVGQYINNQTRLQLYPCEISNKLDLQINDKGLPEPAPEQKDRVYYLDRFNRLVPQSKLRAITLPVFGNFTFFRTAGLETGKCYKICVLMLDKPYPGMVVLSDKDGKPFEFTVPEPGENKNRSTINVDLNQQPLMIPRMKMEK